MAIEQGLFTEAAGIFEEAIRKDDQCPSCMLFNIIKVGLDAFGYMEQDDERGLGDYKHKLIEPDSLKLRVLFGAIWAYHHHGRGWHSLTGIAEVFNGFKESAKNVLAKLERERIERTA